MPLGALSEEDEPGPPASLEHADLLVRLVETGDPPEVDLRDWLWVQLWDVEPKHVLDPTRDLEWDPEPFCEYGEETELGPLFEEVPRDRRFWVSAECWCWSEEVQGCAPTFVAVPPPPSEPGEAWELELPIRSAAWVRGQVAGIGEDTEWLLRCEETGEEFEGYGEESFQLWPIPAGPVTIAATAMEEGRAVHRRFRVAAPTSGALEFGELDFSAGGDRLQGSVRLENGGAAGTSVEAHLGSGGSFGVDLDEDGKFTIRGDLDDLASLTAWSPDRHRFEAASVDLSSPPPRRVDLLLRRRPARLLDVIIDSELDGGEDVGGALVVVLECGPERFARFGPNHDGWCGGGIFTMDLIPPGEARYVAWIPEKGLSGTGTLTIVAPPSEEYLAGRYWEGQPILQTVLRESRTVVSGELVVSPGTSPPGRSPGAQVIVTLCDDPRSEVELVDWMEPGHFSLEGLPSDCEVRLAFGNSWVDSPCERDLRLAPGERLDLGTVTVGP